MKFDEHRARVDGASRGPSLATFTPGRARARADELGDDPLNGNMVVRARFVAQRCADYEREFGAKRQWRRETDPPCAVVALAAELGCSQELVRRLRNVGTRIPCDLLDALLPHRPCLGHLADLSRLPLPLMRSVVAELTTGRKRLGKAICDEEDRLRVRRLRRVF